MSSWKGSELVKSHIPAGMHTEAEVLMVDSESMIANFYTQTFSTTLVAHPLSLTGCNPIYITSAIVDIFYIVQVQAAYPLSRSHLPASL